MNYPLDKTQFIVWAKQQSPQRLVDLKLNLLASQADLQIQLRNNKHVQSDWVSRAHIKLRLTEWRLATVEVLLDQTTLALFRKAANYLLDGDTYDTILEAANAARAS